MNDTEIKYPCEICDYRMKYLDKHHIHSLSKGGMDIPANRTKICPNCHRLVHSGVIILEGRFSSTKGNILVWRYKGQPSITGLPDPPVFLYSDLKQNMEIPNANNSQTKEMGT